MRKDELKARVIAARETPDGQETALGNLRGFADYLRTSPEETIDRVQLQKLGEEKQRVREVVLAIEALLDVKVQYQVACFIRALPRHPQPLPLKRIGSNSGNSAPSAIWFRSRAQAGRVRRDSKASDTLLWPTYVQRWGCVRCGKTATEYGGSGLCNKCYDLIQLRLRHIKAKLAT